MFRKLTVLTLVITLGAGLLLLQPAVTPTLLASTSTNYAWSYYPSSRRDV
jgi:hypothetical protein